MLVPRNTYAMFYSNTNYYCYRSEVHLTSEPRTHILMKALKCKPSASFAYNYSITVLTKYSNIISHRPSIFNGRHINHRSSKVDTSIIDLRRSTHCSSKIEGENTAPTIRHRILSTTALHIISIRQSYTRPKVHV